MGRAESSGVEGEKRRSRRRRIIDIPPFHLRAPRASEPGAPRTQVARGCMWPSASRSQFSTPPPPPFPRGESPAPFLSRSAYKHPARPTAWLTSVPHLAPIYPACYHDNFQGAVRLGPGCVPVYLPHSGHICAHIGLPGHPHRRRDHLGLVRYEGGRRGCLRGRLRHDRGGRFDNQCATRLATSPSSHYLMQRRYWCQCFCRGGRGGRRRC